MTIASKKIASKKIASMKNEEGLLRLQALQRLIKFPALLRWQGRQRVLRLLRLQALQERWQRPVTSHHVTLDDHHKESPNDSKHSINHPNHLNSYPTHASNTGKQKCRK